MDNNKNSRDDYEDEIDNDEFEQEEYITANKTAVDLLSQEIEFERKFYEEISETDKFEVIPIPDENGYILTLEEKRLAEATARHHGIKLLYRISNGKIAIVYDHQTGKIGVMPESNPHGFAC